MMKKAWMAILGFVLAACGDDGEVGTSIDGGANDVRNSDGRRDVDVVCPFEPWLEFGKNGIVTGPNVTVYRKTVCLAGTRWEYARWEQGLPTSPKSKLFCWTDPADCDPSTALAGVRDALANPEVQAALAAFPPVVYGLDRRNEDDGMYVVRSIAKCTGMSDEGLGFDLGDACEPDAPNCHAIPPAIASFAEQLKELERQIQSETHCWKL